MIWVFSAKSDPILEFDVTVLYRKIGTWNIPARALRQLHSISAGAGPKKSAARLGGRSSLMAFT